MLFLVRGLSPTQSGGDVRKLEPTAARRSFNEGRQKWLKFEDIDKSMQELRAMFKVHPEWFEVPKPKSDKGKNEVDYSI